MTFTVYKPAPRTVTRTLGVPCIYFSKPRSTGSGGSVYANASLMAQLREDANKLAIRAHGERIEDDQPIPVIILTDTLNAQLGIAATVEGDTNSVPMLLNKSRKAVIPAGVRLAQRLHMQPGSYETTETTVNNTLVRVIDYRRTE